MRSPQDADFDPKSPDWVPMSQFANETDHGYQKLVKWAKRTSKPPAWFRSHVEIVPGAKNVRYHVHKSSYKGA